VEKAIEELFEDSEEDEEFEGKEPAEKVLIIPADTRISPEAIEVDGKVIIGSNCYLIGNLRVQSVETGKALVLKGSINSEENITIGENSTVYGNLISKGQVNIGRNSRVFGGIRADSVVMHEKARVDGTIKAPSGVSFLREAAGEMPPLADVNALGKVIMVGAEKQLQNEPEEGLVKAVDVEEVDSLIKTGPKVKSGFVPGMEKKSARTRSLARTRHFAGPRSPRKRQGTVEHQS
jgi:predicted acyltransferase (DUF342 family)